jgi:hypothetical protein
MRAFLVAVVLALAGCNVEEPTVIGTVVNVTEAVAQNGEELDLPASYDGLLVPEVAWQIEVWLDDGSRVTVTHSGSRTYAPGDRVRLLLDADGALLL